MGEVYRPTIRSSAGNVAINVLEEELARDDERLKRFQRESKVLAPLSHPGNRGHLQNRAGQRDGLYRLVNTAAERTAEAQRRPGI